MSKLIRTLTQSTVPLLLVLCLASLSVSYAYADAALKPLATQVIGDPDAAVTGKLAVGTATPGNKALTVVGVIDFLGAGAVRNYFTQGAGNNMQINTNVDEANAVGDPTKSQWKLVMGSSLDWFSIRRSPAGGTYNEDALFFIEGSTGNVGIATVDTNNAGAIPFTPEARLHVQTASGHAILGRATATSGGVAGVFGQTSSDSGYGVVGYDTAITGTAVGAYGRSDSTSGRGVVGSATATAGTNYGVYGMTNSPAGYGLYTPNNAFVGGSLTAASLAGSGSGLTNVPYSSVTAAPKVRAFRSLLLNLPSGTATPVGFDSEQYDVGSLHDTVTNSSRFTVPAAGVYRMSAFAQFSGSNFGSERRVDIRVDGSTLIATVRGKASDFGNDLAVTTSWQLNEGQYVEVYVYQDSGNILTVNPTASLTQFVMEYVP